MRVRSFFDCVGDSGAIACPPAFRYTTSLYFLLQTKANCMALPARESPIGKRVSLFVTCIVDMIYPDTGISVVDILEHVGVSI